MEIENCVGEYSSPFLANQVIIIILEIMVAVTGPAPHIFTYNVPGSLLSINLILGKPQEVSNIITPILEMRNLES